MLLTVGVVSWVSSTGCGNKKDSGPVPAEKAPSVAPAAPAPAPPAAPSQASSTPALPPGMIAQDALAPCEIVLLDEAKRVSKNITKATVSTIIASQPACRYEDANGAASFQVLTRWIEPSQVAAYKADLAKSLAGSVRPIDGDPDGALFQVQTGDIASYALHYVRKNVWVELRVLGSEARALQADAAKALLAGMSRGPR
jgi:hypothetical protein